MIILHYILKIALEFQGEKKILFTHFSGSVLMVEDRVARANRYYYQEPKSSKIDEVNANSERLCFIFCFSLSALLPNCIFDTLT